MQSLLARHSETSPGAHLVDLRQERAAAFHRARGRASRCGGAALQGFRTLSGSHLAQVSRRRRSVCARIDLARNRGRRPDRHHGRPLLRIFRRRHGGPVRRRDHVRHLHDLLADRSAASARECRRQAVHRRKPGICRQGSRSRKSDDRSAQDHRRRHARDVSLSRRAHPVVRGPKGARRRIAAKAAGAVRAAHRLRSSPKTLRSSSTRPEPPARRRLR